MRSIRNRLALLFFGITLAAIVGIYLYVVPQLETRLVEEQLDALSADARTYSGAVERATESDVSEATLNRIVREAADRSGDRVTLLAVSQGTEGLDVYPKSDSTTEVDLGGLGEELGLEAARTGRRQTGIERTPDGELGQAAQPIGPGPRVTNVIIYSRSLADVRRNVELIRRQIIVAGGVALAFAVLAGYLIAGVFTRRLRRLEQAAGRISAGDFSQRVPVESDDELGQLAIAFNEMQGQLAQLDIARKRFIATASHELRTPIFSLAGFAELLEDEDLDEETRRKFLRQIRAQAARLQGLSTELLDLSRLEAGSLELHVEPTDVAALARDVTGEFTPVLEKTGTPLVVEVPDGPIEAVCDPDRVAQIVRILIDNAIAHTPDGTEIAVRAQRDNGEVRVAVADHGRGIPAADLQRVFEPFFTSDDAQGAGLGLAIAHELAARMDGQLGVQSDPGGTTFTLSLPTALERTPSGSGWRRAAGR